jgi:FeS assembly protein SufD
MVATTLAHTWEDLAGAALPSRRMEDWRFTDLAALTAIEPRPWSGGDPLASLQLPAGVTRLSDAELAAAAGQTLARTGCDTHWPVRLNAQASPVRLGLRVAAHAAPQALTLSFDAGAQGELLAVHLVLQLEPGASLQVAQRVSATGAGVVSLVCEADLATDARLDWGLVAQGQADAALLGHLAVVQAAGSALNLTAVSAGWALSRLEPRVLQAGGAAHTRLRGLQWVDGHQLADTHSLVRFEGPDGQLDQLHKTVAAGAGRSVFNGAVQVPQVAQRTDAAQLSRSLLLSDRARVDTKPELEIVADDVKCAHGATVSRLQQEELFYLQSRGIGADQAARLLLAGYCQDVLRELPAAAADWQPLAKQLLEP